jgi:hypothetical protein
MGISIDPTPPEPDRSGVAKPAFETVGRLLAGIVGVAADGVPDAAGNFAGAAESGFEAIKAWRAVAETPEHRAWSLWQESLALTMVRFFETAMLTRNPDDEELAALLDEIIEDSRALCASPKTQVIQGHFRTPTEFPLYPALRDKLPAYAKRIALDHVRDDEWLCLRLDRAFERGFQRVLFDEKDYYKPLLDAFDGQAATTANQRDQWERYYRWLWLDVSDRPLFGQQDGGASLADIFQPLRSAWREQGKASGPDEDAGREPDIIHIGWLDEQLEDWLRAGRTDDALRVVSGGPGSGKSSSASMFARKVAFEGRCNVFLIPVGGLNVERPIDEIVKDFVTKTRGRVGALGGNPLDWLETDPLPLLLIFDGLDEVARDDGAGLEVTQRFLNALRDRLGFANGGSKKARLMALALGRPQATEDSILKVGGLKDQVLLHAMPLSPFDETRFGNGGSRQVRLDDPGELRQQDHRENFWRRYRYFDRDCKEERPPEALARPDLAAMTSEPLLLYLLFFSGMDWSQAGANRNGIYEAIFQKIHKRDLEKPQGHKAKVGLESEQDFLALMECLGLAAWLGGGRTGTDEDFEIIRDRVYLTKYSGHFKDKKGAKLRNVAVQTFTHRGDGDEPGYAFIHKSFGEYLTAIALIKASCKWLRRHEGEPEAFAKDWLQLVGSERLTTDILRFIIDEAELRAEGAEPAGSVKDLAGIASHTLAYGFPAHADLLTHRGNADWRRREIFQRNAELALYAVIHAWAEVAYPRELAGKDSAEGGWEAGAVEIAWPELATSPAAAMIDRVRAQWRDDRLARKLFARWDFGEAQRFGIMDLEAFELYGADLRDAKLSGADLRDAKLSGAKLYGADCSRMRIDSARLQSANLSDAVNLTQEQIDKALGNSETKLPDGMRTPEAWLRDD